MDSKEKHIGKEIKKIKKNISESLIYTASAILIAYNTNNSILQIGIFIALLLIILVRKHDPKIPIAFSLIILLISAFQLAFQNETAANNSSKLVYYLLWVGVITRIKECFDKSEGDNLSIRGYYEGLKLFSKITLPNIKSVIGYINNLIKRYKQIHLTKSVYHYIPITLYLSISLLIYLDLNKNYIMVLDMIFPVKNSLKFYFSNPSPIMDTTSWEIQRLYLISAMFISGYSMYKMASRFSMSKIAALYAGLLYMINPYTYVRILAGHLFIILSYGALPLLLIAFVDLLEKNGKKEIIRFVLFLSLVSFSTHLVLIALIFLIFILILWYNKHRHSNIINNVILSALIFILLNMYWIIPFFTAKDSVLNNINIDHLKVYAPKIENFSDLFNIASLYGFWREDYIYTKDFIPYWQIMAVLIILLSVYGFISYYKDPLIGPYVYAFGLIGILGFILASGINGPFGSINQWLFENTILKGFRDSHKFVAMLVMAYSVLGGLGLNKIKRIYDEQEN